MQTQIEKYKETKDQVEEAKEWVRLYQAKLELTEAYQTLEQAKTQLDIAKSEFKEADEHLRWVALDSYEQTGDKNPCPGLKIVVNTKLHYKPIFAILWASQNAPHMVTLRKSLFEKEARQLFGTSQQFSFVEVIEEPTVRIGKDL